MNKIVSYLLICSALLLIGCSGNEYTCVSDAPKELIGDFKSYHTIQDLERKVKMKTNVPKQKTKNEKKRTNKQTNGKKKTSWEQK